MKRILGLALASLLAFPSLSLADNWVELPKNDNYISTFIDIDSLVKTQNSVWYWRLGILKQPEINVTAIKTYEQADCPNGALIRKASILYDSKGQEIREINFETNNIILDNNDANKLIFKSLCSKSSPEGAVLTTHYSLLTRAQARLTVSYMTFI
jgi:hypothetical protein